MLKVKHAISAELDRTLTSMVEDRKEELRTLKGEVKDLQHQLVVAARSSARVAKGLRNQRDAALGKVSEYRSYATKYQRELVAARNEIKKLLKERE